MANLALYRKYRSQTFDEMVGQEHITNALKAQIISGRVSHAYIFTGTRGTGKTSCAKILSRAVNCLNPKNGNPCNVCEACLAALNDSSMDILEIDAASNNGVDSIRQLRDECQYSPAFMKKRVYIIDEVHMLSSGAFNAMLKTLEEPPEHTIFILATTEIHKVPITILSRCQRYDFRRISHGTICDHLEKIAYREGFDISADALSLIAKLGDGSMRDAISLLDRCLSSNDKITYDSALSALSLPQSVQTEKLWKAICSHDASLALRCFDEAYSDGKDIISIFDNLLSLIRDIYIIKTVSNTSDIPFSSSFTAKELEVLSADVTHRTLDYFIETINSALSRLTRTSIRKIDSEVCLIKLCSQREPAIIQENMVSVKAPKKAVLIEDKPSFEDKPPFDIPLDKSCEPKKPDISEPKAEKPLKNPQASSSFKADFLKALGNGVNIAVKQFLNNAEIEHNGGLVVIICDKDYIELLQRTSVTNALNETAVKLGFSSALITDKPIKQAENAGDNEKSDMGMSELIEKARSFGLTN